MWNDSNKRREVGATACSSLIKWTTLPRQGQICSFCATTARMSNDIITISSALLKNCSIRHVSNQAQCRIHLNRLNKPYFLPHASFRARIYAHTNLAIVNHFYGVSLRTTAEFHTDCKLSDQYNPMTNANQNDELPGNNLKRQVGLCALAGKKKE